MPTIRITVSNKLGLHARPAALFVKIAQKFRSDIFVSNGRSGEVNGKSVMGVLSLGAAPGTTLTIRAEGDDAKEALRSLELLALKKFLENRN